MRSIRLLPFDDGITVISCLLGDVTCGFYIDVGASDPVAGSITKPFYDEGWHGINIEPIARHYQRLQKERPRDVNLCLAVGCRAGTVTFYEVPDGTSLSTVSDRMANEYIKAGHLVRTYAVECRTLEEICVQQRVGTVHFLKIDVEGTERSVVEGFSFGKVRPWLVVVEAIDNQTIHDLSSQWESLIVNKGYELVYYDGLNRFYLAQEHWDLRTRLFVPPYLSLRDTETYNTNVTQLSIVHPKIHVERIKWLEGMIKDKDELIDNLRSELKIAEGQIATLGNSLALRAARKVPFGAHLRKLLLFFANGDNESPQA